MKTYKIPYIVGNHPTSGWKGAIDINNHSDSVAEVAIDIYRHPDGGVLSKEVFTIPAWESKLLTPDDLYEKRQSVEITGDNLLITPVQFGESGISNPVVHEVLPKKS